MSSLKNGNFASYSNVTIVLKKVGEDDVDLSNSWSTIEYEDGIPQSVKITLNASFGKFTTVDPILQKYDLIYVEVTDARNKVIDDVFHIKTIKRSRKIGKNKQLTLFCPHQSDNLWKRTISLVAKRTSGFTALNKIVNQLNIPQNKGTDDPSVEVVSPFNNDKKLGNLLDPNTSNNYIFEVVKLQTAINEIIDIEQQPIEGGGSFEAIYVRFKSKYNHNNPVDADLGVVLLQAFPQGFQSNQSNATAKAILGTGVDAEKVDTIDIVNPGSGYISTPTVTISGYGTGATATATLTGGVVTSITVGANGSGYTHPPQVTLTPSPDDEFTNIPNVTLIHQPLGSEATPKTNILSLDTQEEPELATNLHVVGDRIAGSYPVNWVQYQGAKEVFANASYWDIDQNYAFGSLVQHEGTTYECIAENSGNEPPNAAFWIVRTFVKPAIWNFSTVYALNDLVIRLNLSWKCIQAHTADNTNEPPNAAFWVRIFYAPAVDYSPLTKANVQAWVNALAGAQFADGEVGDDNKGKVCIIDPNVIVDDLYHPRTFVRTVIDDPASIPSSDLRPGNEIPDAYRVLAIDPTTGLGPVSGPWVSPNEDRNGVVFSGNIVEWVDPENDGNGEWVVFKSKVLGDDQEVFDWGKAIPWIKNPCNANPVLGIPTQYVNNVGECTLTLGGAGTRETRWIVGSYAISEIPLVGRFGAFIENRQMECAHSVKWDTINHHIDIGTVKILNDDVDGDSGIFIKTEPTLAQGGTDFNPFFCGLNFHAMWPLTSQDDAPFPGSGSAGSDIDHPTFDFNNMFRDHFGVESWFGPQSEDFLPIQAFAFWLQFLLTKTDQLQDVLSVTEGDFSLGIWMADRRDNIRIIDDMTQSRKDITLGQKGNLPGKAYKGVPGASQFFGAQEPDTTDAFDPREFLVGGLYTRDSFDGNGRYIGLKSRFTFNTQLEMRMDGWRMLKPLVVTNVDVLQDKPTRNLDTQLIKKQNITSYAQLKNLVLGLDKIFNFERREFDEDTSGRCDIAFGDSVYYTDSEMINDTTDALDNTVKGVNSKNIISLSKGKDGPGGFTAKFGLVTRLWP